MATPNASAVKTLLLVGLIAGAAAVLVAGSYELSHERIAANQREALLPGALKVPATKVEGCASQVWLHAEIEGEGQGARFQFRGDSDAMIVRGLIGVVVGDAVDFDRQ